MHLARSLVKSLARLVLILASSKIGSHVVLLTTALLVLPTTLVLLAMAWLGLHYLVDAAHFVGVPSALTFTVAQSTMTAWAGVIVYGTALLEHRAIALVRASRTKV